ncbi:hypothetical protein PPACK8108_LOCUS2731 [Phakopsora pachyrhizi]|uniref:Uncharacterized protein n=1 Tax=Phakopsora pachyrhizi TaxID=170000 RepID=A0AAV0AIL6_PHAPC|nr:hypothetical protein PPACK8108_LOCUS2731 [Phakopsora pachyrhizi]
MMYAVSLLVIIFVGGAELLSFKYIIHSFIYYLFYFIFPLKLFHTSFLLIFLLIYCFPLSFSFLLLYFTLLLFYFIFISLLRA